MNTHTSTKTRMETSNRVLEEDLAEYLDALSHQSGTDRYFGTGVQHLPVFN
jgi:hypothetical protein